MPNANGLPHHRPTEQSSSAPGVLVVDDDPAVLGFLEYGLTRAGFRTFGASNMADAVTLFELVCRHVRLALLDVSMPRGDGPEVLRELRLLRPELPAVFMSGELDPDLTNPLATRLRAEGATGLIAKPMRLPDLCAVLTEVLDGQPRAACGLPSNGSGG